MSFWDAVAARASAWGTRTALRMQAAEVTYDELRRRVDACARVLARGPADELVALDAGEPLAFVVAAFAARAVRRPAIVHTAAIPPALREKREQAVAGSVSRDATVFFSSGSVGAGKAIPLDSRNLLFSALAYAASEPEGGANRSTDRIAVGVPVGHIYGFVRGILDTLLSGAAMLPFTPRRDPAGEAAALGANRVLLSARQMLLTARAKETARLDAIFSGGAAIPDAAIRAIEEKRGIPVRTGYGLTESAGVGTRQRLDRPRRPGSSGLPAPGVAVAVVRSDGSPAAVGEDGEIRLAGPCVFSGYASGTEPPPFDEGGRLRTGDLGRLDDAGELLVRGRAAFSLVSRGRLLCAEELESAALEQPGVSDAAAVPLGDSFGLLLVTEDATEVGVREIRERLSRELPVFARPRRIRRVDEIPRSPLGKIDRNAAARWLAPS